MPYFYLVGAVLGSASVNILSSYYNRRTDGMKDATPLFSFIQLATIFLCWAGLFAFDFSFNIRVLPYSLAFALFYCSCNIALVSALKFGPVSLTTLFVGLSLLLTTAWGFFRWNAEFTLFVGLGLAFVVASVYLCLYTGKKDEKKVSWKWLFCVTIAIVGNAGSAIIQREQQMAFNGAHANMLMACATLFSAIFALVLYLRSDRTDSKMICKKSVCFPVLAGVAGVLLNVFVIRLALTNLSSSLIYPVIGVGGLMAVTLYSLFGFKEKLKWQQWLGVVCGAIATALLSL